MIGTIWESVLRVPILLLLSDAVFFGPGRGFSDPQKWPKNFFAKILCFLVNFFIIFNKFYTYNFFMFFTTFFVKKWSFLGVQKGGLEGVDFGPFLGGPRQLSRGPIFDYFLINFLCLHYLYYYSYLLSLPL